MIEQHYHQKKKDIFCAAQSWFLSARSAVMPAQAGIRNIPDNWVVVIFCLIGIFLAKFTDFKELPVSVFGTITAIFSYYAYRFSKEKFRLDLFEKRWELYEEALKLCSIIIAYQGIPDKTNSSDMKNMLTNMEGCLRGMGWHKTRLLFGQDIQNAFEELKESVHWILSREGLPGNSQEEHQKYTKEKEERLDSIYNFVRNLPDLFAPYLYFGNYKADERPDARLRGHDDGKKNRQKEIQ